jgi:hypothetical protein
LYDNLNLLQKVSYTLEREYIELLKYILNAIENLLIYIDITDFEFLKLADVLVTERAIRILQEEYNEKSREVNKSNDFFLLEIS